MAVPPLASYFCKIWLRDNLVRLFCCLELTLTRTHLPGGRTNRRPLDAGHRGRLPGVVEAERRSLVGFKRSGRGDTEGPRIGYCSCRLAAFSGAVEDDHYSRLSKRNNFSMKPRLVFGTAGSTTNGPAVVSRFQRIVAVNSVSAKVPGARSSATSWSVSES
jgi:hypothetical protein